MSVVNEMNICGLARATNHYVAFLRQDVFQVQNNQSANDLWNSDPLQRTREAPFQHSLCTPSSSSVRGSRAPLFLQVISVLVSPNSPGETVNLRSQPASQTPAGMEAPAIP